MTGELITLYKLSVNTNYFKTVMWQKKPTKQTTQQQQQKKKSSIPQKTLFSHLN